MANTRIGRWGINNTNEPCTSCSCDDAPGGEDRIATSFDTMVVVHRLFGGTKLWEFDLLDLPVEDFTVEVPTRYCICRVKFDDSGNLIVLYVGATLVQSGFIDFLLYTNYTPGIVKLDSDGNLLWHTNLGLCRRRTGSIVSITGFAAWDQIGENPSRNNQAFGTQTYYGIEFDSTGQVYVAHPRLDDTSERLISYVFDTLALLSGGTFMTKLDKDSGSVLHQFNEDTNTVNTSVFLGLDPPFTGDVADYTFACAIVSGMNIDDNDEILITSNIIAGKGEALNGFIGSGFTRYPLIIFDKNGGISAPLPRSYYSRYICKFTTSGELIWHLNDDQKGTPQDEVIFDNERDDSPGLLEVRTPSGRYSLSSNGTQIWNDNGRYYLLGATAGGLASSRSVPLCVHSNCRINQIGNPQPILGSHCLETYVFDDDRTDNHFLEGRHGFDMGEIHDLFVTDGFPEPPQGLPGHFRGLDNDQRADDFFGYFYNTTSAIQDGDFDFVGNRFAFTGPIQFVYIDTCNFFECGPGGRFAMVTYDLAIGNINDQGQYSMSGMEKSIFDDLDYETSRVHPLPADLNFVRETDFNGDTSINDYSRILQVRLFGSTGMLTTEVHLTRTDDDSDSDTLTNNTLFLVSRSGIGNVTWRKELTRFQDLALSRHLNSKTLDVFTP